MRFRPIFFAVVSLIGLSLGCAARSSRGSKLPDSRVGVFRFLEQVPNTSPTVTLEGVVTVERDTILLDAASGLCYYDHLRSGATTVTYKCADVWFTFDRHNPIDRARYSFVTTVHVPVRRCVRYTTASDGRRVCAQMETELVARDVRRSGRLRPYRVE